MVSKKIHQVQRTTFKKTERLSSRKIIESLLSAGMSELRFPYRIFWKLNGPDASPLQVAISIPKKKIRKAVDRTLLKRRTREIFRLQKQGLYEALGNGKSVHLFIIYVSDKVLPYSTLEISLGTLINNLSQLIHETAS